LVFEAADGQDPAEVDPYHDPSVRFFGLDWQQLFARCFSLSLNVAALRVQLTEPGVEVDLVLLSGVLRDLARIEIEVAAHGEAVLHGRLSKSQQMLISREQSRVSSMTPTGATATASARVSKSRSFRESSSGRKQQRYRKNRTTDLHKLSLPSALPSNNSSSTAATASHAKRDEEEEEELNKEWREVMAKANAENNGAGGDNDGGGGGKRKTSFIQNVSSLFKNMR
jgi:hypothetical protein